MPPAFETTVMRIQIHTLVPAIQYTLEMYLCLTILPDLPSKLSVIGAISLSLLPLMFVGYPLTDTVPNGLRCFL